MGRLVGIARRETKRAAMETLEHAKINMDTGVAGDFRGKPGRRQVTILSAQAWQAVCDELGKDIPWTVRRANLLIDDLDLPKEAGHVIQIGDVQLRATMEVDPCARMEEQVSGLKKALIPDWRGGVACEVLAGGSVSLGDKVSIVE